MGGLQARGSLHTQQDLRIHVDLPVGFACDVHPAEVAAVVFGVCAPKQQLAAWLSCGVSEKKGQKSPTSEAR